MAGRVRIGRVEDFAPGSMREVEADGTKLIVAREGDDLCAARNRCPHLGLSLTSGPGGQHYADGVVQCPWHNSRFVVRTGENLDWASGIAGRSIPRWSRRVLSAGRRPAPLTTYPVVVADGEVFVEL
ncbi:MAG: Rieske 2Fe-2S domain-containing protein [Candidatus Nanopelagicales bacterium]|jgi:nitrite reductase/ring-hydroxylating ferredoxin subunit|nr:Rieske 2Fe-2S domain-containing protein [Candidatus Nanopelagicales bacterium]